MGASALVQEASISSNATAAGMDFFIMGMVCLHVDLKYIISAVWIALGPFHHGIGQVVVYESFM